MWSKPSHSVLVAPPCGSWQPAPSLEYLEQVECWVKHPLDDLFQELLENTVLIDPCLVHPEVIDKLHADHAFHGMLGQLPQLLVAVLPRAEVQPIKTPLHTRGSPKALLPVRALRWNIRVSQGAWAHEKSSSHPFLMRAWSKENSFCGM